MEKNFEVFIEQDHKEHLERSLDAIRTHSDRNNALAVDERKEYFKGLMGMFPVMLLGHYYGWLIDEEPKDYFEIFVPKFKEKYEAFTDGIVDQIFDEQTTEAEHAALLSSYMQAYPLDLLCEFVFWADPDAMEKIGAFVAAERCDSSAALTMRIADETGKGKYVELASYLAGDFPFELIARFHKAVMG